MESPYSEIEFEIEKEVAIIRFARPDQGNAMNVNMALEVESALNRCGWEREVGAVVLTGKGDWAFSIGIDLAETPFLTSLSDSVVLNLFKAVTIAIVKLDKPVVAAVNGLAAGTGFHNALAADWRIGCSRSRMALSGIDMGLEDALSVFSTELQLPRSIEQSIAYTGRTLELHECSRYGLLNEIVGASDLVTRAVDRAHDLMRRPSVAFKHTKAFFRELLLPRFETQIKTGIKQISVPSRYNKYARNVGGK